MMSQSANTEELEEFVQEIMLSDDYSGKASPQVRDRIHSFLNKQIGESNRNKQEGGGINIGIKPWQIVSVASVILFAATAIYSLTLNKSPKEIAKTGINRFKNGLAPGSNKAILTLANGSTIILDSASIGTVASQGNSKVIKSDSGQLAYSINSSPLFPGKGVGSAGEIVYNTLTTPRGGKYQLELPDSSKVWLNAASSIRYPTVFAGRERKLEISGEAYFEVTKNPKMPFIVNINNDVELEVLGTHFNVMAYSDEPTVKTTLLEGSVKILKGNVNRILKPGEQAELNPSG